LTRYDFHLSPAAPLDATNNLHPEETALEVDFHDGVEVGVMLTGRMERHTEDRVVSVLPGDVWLCAAWEPHGWRVTERSTQAVVLIFIPEFLGEERLGSLSWLSLFAAPPPRRPRVTSTEMRERALQIGHEMLREIEEQRSAWQSAVRLELLRLLLTLSRDWQPPEQLEHILQMSAGQLARVRPALDLLRARKHPSVGEAAHACGLSRSQFCLVFRNATGLSYGKLCGRLRLGLVAQLLLSTDWSVAAIAEETGFVDASHLHRAFARQYGSAPGAYRVQHRPQ
jgi:AraC-like DNA-binding protein